MVSIGIMGADVIEMGYLAVPPTGSGAGVIVLQEWWGLVPHIKSVADRFAAAGYVALAPATAATDAWNRTLQFLQTSLEG